VPLPLCHCQSTHCHVTGRVAPAAAVIAAEASRTRGLAHGECHCHLPPATCHLPLLQLLPPATVTATCHCYCSQLPLLQPTATVARCHCDPLPASQCLLTATLPHCHTATLPPTVTLSHCHTATLPHCQTTTLSHCHPLPHTATLLSFPLCHTATAIATLSHCHCHFLFSIFLKQKLIQIFITPNVIKKKQKQKKQ
jgi:hypothetical protein